MYYVFAKSPYGTAYGNQWVKDEHKHLLDDNNIPQMFVEDETLEFWYLEGDKHPQYYLDTPLLEQSTAILYEAVSKHKDAQMIELRYRFKSS